MTAEPRQSPAGPGQDGVPVVLVRHDGALHALSATCIHARVRSAKARPLRTVRGFHGRPARQPGASDPATWARGQDDEPYLHGGAFVARLR
jgi:hypothetical protein